MEFKKGYDERRIKTQFKKGIDIRRGKPFTGKDGSKYILNTGRTRFKKGRVLPSEIDKKRLKNLMKKPTKPEKVLNQLLHQNFPNEWKYVGDGEFILGGKNPDFLNINGQKKVIEMFGNYWHRNDDSQDRIDHFKKYGFNTLVVWERELQNLNEVIEKIRGFGNE